MDINTAIAYVQTLALTCVSTTGEKLQAAPENPTDILPVDPSGAFVETSEAQVSVDLSEPYSASWGPQTAIIRSELYVIHKNRALDVPRLKAFRDPFLRLIMNNPNLNGSVMNCSRVTSTPITVQWGDMPLLGLRFDIEVVLELSPS